MTRTSEIQKEIERKVIKKLTKYFNILAKQRTGDTFRGMVSELKGEYIDMQLKGYLDFNNSIFAFEEAIENKVNAKYQQAVQKLKEDEIMDLTEYQKGVVDKIFGGLI